MPAWRIRPATLNERRPSWRVMPPRLGSPRVLRTLAGSSWPGTSMSVATNSTSWRSTQALPRRSSSSRSAGGPGARSGYPRRPWTIASELGCGPRRSASSIEVRCPVASHCRTCRCGSTSWSLSRGTGSGTIATRCRSAPSSDLHRKRRVIWRPTSMRRVIGPPALSGRKRDRESTVVAEEQPRSLGRVERDSESTGTGRGTAKSP
jgi:hypothetical protein